MNFSTFAEDSSGVEEVKKGQKRANCRPSCADTFLGQDDPFWLAADFGRYLQKTPMAIMIVDLIQRSVGVASYVLYLGFVVF